MLKIFRAVWCFVILRDLRGVYSRAIILWILTITESLKIDGFLGLGDVGRNQMSEWFLESLITDAAELDIILTALVGDAFIAKNRIDVAHLEREAGKSVIMLWDTDPIFNKYPHLRALGRNKYFEEHILPAYKQRQK